MDITRFNENRQNSPETLILRSVRTSDIDTEIVETVLPINHITLPPLVSDISINIQYLATSDKDDTSENSYLEISDDYKNGDDDDHTTLPNSDSSTTDSSDIEELQSPSKIKHVRFNIENDTKNANLSKKRVKKIKKSSYKGGKINHKSINLCPCQHCYVLNFQNIFHEVTMDVAAVSHDAKPGDETFDLPEIPMWLGRQGLEENFMNNNDEELIIASSEVDMNRRWHLYEGLDNFVEEWGDQLREFNCWDSIFKAISFGASWTFRKIIFIFRKGRTCKVAPVQGSITDLTVHFQTILTDDEFNANQSKLRRTNSCEF